MANDDKSRLTESRSGVPTSTPEEVKRALSSIKPMRSPEDLEPIVNRVAANHEIMRQFRAAAGSENQALAEAAIDAVFAFAQTIDPGFTRVEATRVAVALMKII